MNANGTLNVDDMTYVLDKLEQIADILLKISERLDVLEKKS